MKKIVLAVSILGLILGGCSSDSATKNKQAQMQLPPLPVEAYEVVLQDANFTKRYSAILKPFEQVAITVRIDGILEKEHFVEGSYVTKGSKLYELQKDEYKAALDLAAAAEKKAHANLVKVQKDFARGEYLFSNKAISQQQYDDLLYLFESAKAERDETKASLEKAKIEYGYTTIKAPISGQIGLSRSDVGTLINSTNATLNTITALDPIYAEFSLPNSDALAFASQIKLGASITLKQADKNYIGAIDFIAPTLDAATDTLLVRATFKNSDKRLLIGSYAEVILGGFSYKNVAIVPQNALIKTPEAMVVYVISDEGVVSMRPVEVAQSKEGRAIITSGLGASEKIVTSNIAKLRPNAKVTIVDGK